MLCERGCVLTAAYAGREILWGLTTIHNGRKKNEPSKTVVVEGWEQATAPPRTAPRYFSSLFSGLFLLTTRSSHRSPDPAVHPHRSADACTVAAMASNCHSLRHCFLRLFRLLFNSWE